MATNTIEVDFMFERETKNHLRFQEHLEDPLLDSPNLGDIYVPKRTLKALGWKKEIPLHITIGLGTQKG